MPKSLIRRTSMAMCRATLHAYGAQLPTVEWESFGERGDLAANLRRNVFRSDVPQHFGDQLGHRAHLWLAESARGDGGRTEAHAARIHRRIGVERDRVAVGGDARVLERGLRFLPPDPLREHVNQEQMRIRAARYNTEV